MTQEEFDRITYASQEIIKLSDELIGKLEANKAMIDERRIASAATNTMTSQVSGLMNQLLAEIRVSDAPAEQTLSKVVEFLVSLVSTLQSSQSASEEELIRLTATQDGMRRALEAVRETGALRLQELRRIETLSQQDNPEARRSIGARPETVAAKRNAKSLKQNREGDDT